MLIITILTIFVLSIGIVIALQIYPIQNYFAKIAINNLSKQINANIYLTKFKFSNFNTIELYDVHFNDNNNNNLMSAGYIKIKIHKIVFKKNYYHLKEVVVNDYVFNHIKYENSNKSNIMMLFPYKEKKEKRKPRYPITVLSDYVKIDNWVYQYKDYNHKENNIDIDFKDIYVYDACGEFVDLSVINDSVALQILNITLKEKKGFYIKSFNSFFTISSSTLRSLNTFAKTGPGHSDFDIDLIFNYSNWQSYRDFTDSVHIIGKVRDNSYVNLIDISKFTSVLAGADNLLDIMADVDGPVNNMRIYNIDLHIFDTTFYAGEVLLKDITKAKNRALGLNIDKFVTKYNDMQSFNIPVFKKNVYNPYNLSLPNELKKLGTISLNGNFYGMFDDFKTNIYAYTDLGRVNANITYSLIDNTDKNEFDISLEGKKIEIGKIVNIKDKISSFDVNITSKGTAHKFIPDKFYMDLNFSNLALNDVILNDINAHFESSDEELLATISVFNEDLYLDASVNSTLFNIEQPIINSSINISNANLKRLGLIKYDGDFIIDGFMNANIIGTKMNTMQVIFNASNLNITANNKIYPIGDIVISQKISPDSPKKNIILNSSFANMAIDGIFDYNNISKYYSNILSGVLPKYFHKDNDIEDEFTYLNAYILFKNPEVFNFILGNDISIAKNSSVDFNFSNDKDLNFQLLSDSLTYSSYKIKNVNMNINCVDSNLFTLVFKADNVHFSDIIESSSFMNVSNMSIVSSMQNNNIIVGLDWIDTIYNKTSSINVNANISNLPLFCLDIDKSSHFSLQNNEWKIKTLDDICIGQKYYSLGGLAFTASDNSQEFIVNGVLSESVKDSLKFSFNDVDLFPINLFLHNNNYFAGILNGEVSVSALGKNPYFSAFVNLNDIFLKDKYIGDIAIQTTWVDSIKAVSLNTSLYNTADSYTDSLLLVECYYFPASEDGNIDGNVKLSNFDFAIFDSFLNSFITNIKGNIFGDINISNNIHNPKLNGLLSLKNAGMKVKYTDADYTFSNSVDVNIVPNGIVLDGFKLFDQDGKFFDISGKITHTNWKDINLNVHSNFDKFTILDSQPIYHDNNVFYGKALLSGIANIEGNTNNLNIAANVATDVGTELTINLASNKSVTEHSFIHFVTNEEEKPVHTINTHSNTYQIDAKLDIGYNTKLNVILPYSLGSMSINGTGNLSYQQKKDGSFNVVGDYYISSGNLQLTYQNLVQRDFSIKEGGSIVFNGNPLNSIMNVEAVYQVRASLSGLPSINDEELHEKKIPVDCVIEFSGQLSNPEVGFRIDMPNVDEVSRAMIESSINLNDQAVVAEQFFYLLILNSFYTSNNSYAMTVSGLGSSSLSLISNQITNLLSSFTKNIDFGINYNIGDELNPDKLDFMLKAGLFNNRVLIDGNLGVQNNNSVQNGASSIVGDVLAEYKITRDGRLRAKAFNRSNDYKIIEQVAPYTQGIGLSYYTEFDKISDLFRKKKNIRQY